MRIAPINDMADKAINKVKYKGEMVSTVCHDEYLIINSDDVSKKTEARKYPINPIELPKKVNMHRALKNGVLLRFPVFIINELVH